MTLSYTVKPVTDFTVFTTPPAHRKGIPFKASWDRTLKDLAAELEHLQARDVVMELDVRPDRIRRDGLLYADAKVGHPGVRLTFGSKHGQLSYTCDTYEARYYGQMPDWQANVRAIVLTLESLRAVDRYGATRGEQYSGFAALPAGTGGIALGGMTRDQARSTLLAASDWAEHADDWQGWGDDHAARKVYRSARFNVHPDRNGGDQVAWDQVAEAARVLGLDR